MHKGQFLSGEPETREAIARFLGGAPEIAGAYMEAWRWPDRCPRCPYCGEPKPYVTGRMRRDLPRFRCRACRRDFTVFSGTEIHHPKLCVTVYAAALMAASDKTMSARQFGIMASVNPRTVHYLLAKLRGPDTDTHHDGQLPGIRKD